MLCPCYPQETSTGVLPGKLYGAAPHPLLRVAVYPRGTGALAACIQPLSAAGGHALGDFRERKVSTHIAVTSDIYRAAGDG